MVGQKRGFTLAQVQAIEAHLTQTNNAHDLALLSFGIDSFFRAGDLLQIKCKDICYPNGQIRRLIPRKQQKTKRAVCPVLTPPAQSHLQNWLKLSAKKPEDFVFTRGKDPHGPAIGRDAYAMVVKGWAEMLGLNPAEYSTHSMRRSKPEHMYQAGEDIALISRLLGHKSIAVTIEYLGINQAKAEAAALRHPMLKGR